MKQRGFIGSTGVVKISVTVLAVLLLQLPGLALAKKPTAEKLTVMTRNLYLGAELMSLAAGPSEEFPARVQAALNQIAVNNFPERAEALAAEIAEKKPHLVGLQEVYDFTIYEGHYVPPFWDYLAYLLDALEAQGASYYVAATVKNLDVTVGDIHVVDRDVILARADVETEVVDLTGLCQQSEDGCNYYYNLPPATTPDGTIIEFKRGFVAVDTGYGRFFTTHLEVQFPDPNNPASAIIQTAQAEQLLYVIYALSPPAYGQVVVVGDFNSSPEHLPIDIPGLGTLYTPYIQFTYAGFTDMWTLRPGKPKGYTCCYDEDLGVAADLYERIDMIFSDTVPGRVKANVVGNDDEDQTPSGLYPSDHAGVVSTMEF